MYKMAYEIAYDGAKNEKAVNDRDFYIWQLAVHINAYHIKLNGTDLSIVESIARARKALGDDDPA